MVNFNDYKVLSFDCYGTLIDWEQGIVDAVKPVLKNHYIKPDDERILNLFTQIESAAQQGEFKRYTDILHSVVSELGNRLGFVPAEDERGRIVENLGKWKPFSDTIAALKNIKKKFKIAIISNIDDDLFKLTNKTLDVEFDWIITSEQVGSYKPSTKNFKYALEKMGHTGGQVLHIAQSTYHDIIPAKAHGISTVLVGRKTNRSGSAIPHASTTPDVKVPDLKSLVERMKL